MPAIPEPQERQATLRHQLADLLRLGPQDCRDLSQALGVSEKEIRDHLQHLARAYPKEFVVEAARCRACGFVFRTAPAGKSERSRKKLSRPGRCPRCRSSHIAPPRFSLRG